MRTEPKWYTLLVGAWWGAFLTIILLSAVELILKGGAQ